MWTVILPLIIQRIDLRNQRPGRNDQRIIGISIPRNLSLDLARIPVLQALQVSLDISLGLHACFICAATNPCVPPVLEAHGLPSSKIPSSARYLHLRDKYGIKSIHHIPDTVLLVDKSLGDGCVHVVPEDGDDVFDVLECLIWLCSEVFLHGEVVVDRIISPHLRATVSSTPDLHVEQHTPCFAR